MAPRIQRLDPRKVGEDIVLPFVFTQGTAALPISAANVTIQRVDGQSIVVDGAPITLTSENTGEYIWQPTIGGEYLIESHALYGDGIDVRSATAAIFIEDKIGTLMEFAGGEDTPAPVVFPIWRIPGIYDVPSGSVAGELVAITGVLTAATYATRASGGPAADAVILEKLSDATARLGRAGSIDSFEGLTPGAPLYLGVDGAVSHTAADPGEVDQIVGEAETTTRATIWTIDRPRVAGSATVEDHEAAADPHTQYSRADGTRAFSAVVSGVTPTTSAHLATKGYVDTADALKAPLASPTFTGAPAAPTADPGTNTTQLATTGFVKAALDVVLGGVSAAFDTLAEIAAELASLAASVALKLPLSGGTMTGALNTTEGTFTETGGVVSIDATTGNDHRQTDTLGATTVATLVGSAGRQGMLHFVQDATGRALTFAASGRTVYQSQAVPTTANARIDVGYKFVGTTELHIYVTPLPVTY